MFRIKENLYATQFHPELDAEGLVTRIDIYRHAGYFPPESAEELMADARPIHCDRAHEHPEKLRGPLRHLSAPAGSPPSFLPCCPRPGYRNARRAPLNSREHAGHFRQ